MKNTLIKFTLSAGAALALAMFAVPSYGQVTTTLINDDFGDGQGSNTGDVTAVAEASFFTTSSSSGISTDPAFAVSGGGFRFISGTSGRAIHTLFNPTSLAFAGDRIDVSFDFTTPATVSADGSNEEFRFGLFDTSNASGVNIFNSRNITAGAVGTDGGTPIDFSANIPSASGNNQPGLELAGFTAEIDIENNTSENISFRVSDITGDSTAFATAGGGTSTAGDGISGNGPPSGRLTTTTQGFDGLGGGSGFGAFTVTGLTDYTGTLTIERRADGDFDVTSSLDGGGLTAAATLASDTILATGVGGEAGLDTATFDLLTFSASGAAFGTSNGADNVINATGLPGSDGILDEDNGITFTNVTVTSTLAAAIPEPSSLALLGLMSCAGLVRRRR